jgi:hypothetical protein
MLVGEDGTVDFTADEVPYDSVKMTATVPKTIIHVEGTVNWNQKFTGNIDFGTRAFTSMTGDGITADWPKPGAGLGGGWSVLTSSINDPNNINGLESKSFSYSWQNKEKKHANYDTMSVNVSWSGAGATPYGPRTGVLTSSKVQMGFQDAYATTDDGTGKMVPAPVNIPFSEQYTWTWPASWTGVSGGLNLQYDADAGRTETVRFDLYSDLQEMITVPDVPTTIDILQLTAAHVDIGTLDIKDYLDVAGLPVTVGQVIQVPASVTPLIPQACYQICTIAGTTVLTEPTFSDVIGTPTVWGSATFISLGTSLNNSLSDWKASTTFTDGVVIQPLKPSSLTYSQLWNTFPLPVTGASVSAGQIVYVPGLGYFQCTFSGTTLPPTSTVSWNTSSIGATTTDGTALFAYIGTSIPNGGTFWLQTHSPSGTTGSITPPFGSQAVGTTLSDGTCVWYSLGTQGNFIAPPIGDASRSSYFPSARGLWSLEYCIQMASNHLMKSARCVTIEFDCLPQRIPGLNLRMNARLFDPRIPGGYAWGKITEYSLAADGSTGLIVGHVKMECPIGKDNVVSPVTGAADYIVDDYIDPTYYQHTGSIILIPGDEAVGYSVPVATANPNELNFPLTYASAVITDEIVGDPSTQMVEATRQIQNQSSSLNDYLNFLGANQGQTSSGSNSQNFNLSSTPLFWHLVLKPVTGVSFSNDYDITVTKLVLPMGINMEAS